MSLHPADLARIMADVDPQAAAECEPWLDETDREIRHDLRAIVVRALPAALVTFVVAAVIIIGFLGVTP